MSKLHVCSPCYNADVNKLALLRDSCNKVGITLNTYGVNSGYKSNYQIKIIDFIDYLSKVSEDYVLLLDGFDTLVIRGEENILLTLSSDVLMLSSKGNAGNFDYPFPKTSYPYFNTGAILGKVKSLVNCLNYIIQSGDHTDFDKFGYFRAYAKGMIDIDHGCNLGQLFTGNEQIEVKNKLIYNKETNSYPCIAHWPFKMCGREAMWKTLNEE